MMFGCCLTAVHGLRSIVFCVCPYDLHSRLILAPRSYCTFLYCVHLSLSTPLNLITTCIGGAPAF